ncbi:MAG TPA: hypothetical protein VGM76_01770 [Lacipirellulaceae bacterium]|jgi:hypothetical protein
MKTNLMIKVSLIVASLMVFSGLAKAASLTLNFNSASGTVLDKDGQGTGFTTRLSGTGANIPANDPRMDLDTAAGVIHIDPPNVDYNGQVSMGDAENPGINLSSLGFTGTQDFSATAVYTNIPDNTQVSQPDQLGMYVGTSSTAQMRGGFINFDTFLDPGETRSNEGFGVNNNGTTDINPRFFGSDVGTTMTIQLGRTGGVWRLLVNGVDRLPNVVNNGSGAPAPPIWLNGQSNVVVGPFALDLGGDDTGIFDLDSFSVVVAAGGDANNDGHVDLLDFNLISDNLFKTVPIGTLGDLTGDGKVDYSDFRLWKNNYIPGPGAGAVSIGSVPEPTSCFLMTSAFLGVFLLSRRGR